MDMDMDKAMELFKNNTVVSWHEHVYINETTRRLDYTQCDRLAKVGELLHINKIVVSRPVWWGVETPELTTIHNNVVSEAINRYAGLMYGMCFIDPHHGKTALSEIDRCITDLGFIGVKLYNQRAIDDPLQYPIIEKCIKLDIPILMHAGKGSAPYSERHPLQSDGSHFLNIAKRYPEAVFIIGHIGGGGDWHWQLKEMGSCPNVFIDIGGSVYDHGIVEETVAVFGADRVLFAADMSFSASVGKLLGAEINGDDKITILAGARMAKYFKN